MNKFLNKLTRKYFRNIKFYSTIILKQISIFCEYPVYYLKEYLEIIKSLTTSLLLEFPNIKLKEIIRKINGVYYPFYFNFAPRYRGMYLGMNSMPLVRVLLKYLKKGTTFIDAGANIGYISAIGASLVGKKGQVHCFEPIPVYFEKLSEMARLNKNYQIFINKCSLGNIPGKSFINININKNIIGANTMVPGLLEGDVIKETIKIDVKRLDDYIYENNIDNISLLKIDVEGFELFLFEGLIRYFEENKKKLPPIIVEITPSAYPLIGKNVGELDNLMKKYYYSSYSLDEKYKINIKNITSLTDILFKHSKTN